jgi:protein-tyrosine phosphatase
MTALAWEGCLNVRDLGGLPTEDGRKTRAGGIVRSDNVRKLTDAGWRSLAEHGVTRIVDLRWPEELAEDQPRDVEIEVVHVSVLGEAIDPDYIEQLDEHLDPVEDVADHYAWSYVDFLERYRGRFGLAFAAIADADGTVVVHCAGGKDRTGLISALLLRLVGVGHREIGADYAVSERNLGPALERQWNDVPVEGIERARREKLGRTPAGGMIRAVEEIERRYGDVASYLRAAGLADAQIDRLRARLVTA